MDAMGDPGQWAIHVSWFSVSGISFEVEGLGFKGLDFECDGGTCRSQSQICMA